jgi:hypothetical protein
LRQLWRTFPEQVGQKTPNGGVGGGRARGRGRVRGSCDHSRDHDGARIFSWLGAVAGQSHVLTGPEISRVGDGGDQCLMEGELASAPTQ